MSIIKGIVALAIAMLFRPADAAPLGVYTSATASITAVSNRFPELGYTLYPGMSIGVDFDNEIDTSLATVDANGWTTAPTPFSRMFSITSGGYLQELDTPFISGNPASQNWIRIQDNVLNGAGELVDVFELHARGATSFIDTNYSVLEHLEFAPATFSGLDIASLLAVANAPLGQGTVHLLRVAENWDATFEISDLDAAITSFAIRFDGPGAQIPRVPEPGQYLLLLAGMTGAAAWRRRSL